MISSWDGIERRRRMDAPLTRNSTPLLPPDTTPHTGPVDDVLGAGVDSVEREVFGFAPGGNKAPFHGLHYEAWLRS